MHVDTTNDVITVLNESGVGVPLTVDANTQFFFRQPQSPAADSQPIATGTAFLSSQNLVRGFKVHASVVDPLATPLVAQSIDIETAQYSGAISAPGTAGFTYTHDFRSGRRRLRLQDGVHLEQHGQRQRRRRQSHHRLQMVELRLSDPAHQRSGCGGRFRRRHRRQRELWRHRRRRAVVRCELLGLERSRESEWLGRRGQRTASIQAASGNGRDGSHRQRLHHERRRRLDARDGRGEHDGSAPRRWSTRWIEPTASSP